MKIEYSHVNICGNKIQIYVVDKAKNNSKCRNEIVFRNSTTGGKKHVIRIKSLNKNKYKLRLTGYKTFAEVVVNSNFIADVDIHGVVLNITYHGGMVSHTGYLLAFEENEFRLYNAEDINELITESIRL